MFSEDARYKGKLISEMERDELLVVLEEQIIEARRMMKFVDWQKYVRVEKKGCPLFESDSLIEC